MLHKICHGNAVGIDALHPKVETIMGSFDLDE